MSWSYSGNPSASTLDQCRFILQDTVEAEPIMQDEEIQYLIDTYGDNENELYYNLFARAATLFSRDIKKSLGPESEDPTERLSFYKAQMAYYKKRTCVSGISQPKSTGPKIFYTDMHSNPPRQLGGVHNVP